MIYIYITIDAVMRNLNGQLAEAAHSIPVIQQHSSFELLMMKQTVSPFLLHSPRLYTASLELANENPFNVNSITGTLPLFFHLLRPQCKSQVLSTTFI